jgi:transcriptional enhancer factor
LFSAHANAGALVEYDADGVGANWHLQGAEPAFDADGGWDGYAGPAWETTAVNGKESHDGNGGFGWPDTAGAGSVGQMEKLNSGWSGTNGTVVDEEKNNKTHAIWGQHQEEEEENSLDTSLRDTEKAEGRDELPWSDVVLSNSPNKQNGAGNSYIEGSIESKLLPWIEQATAEEEAQAQAQARGAFQEVEVVSAGATGIVDIEALERAVKATENSKQENGLGYHGVDLNGQHETEAQGWGRIDHDNIGGSAEAVVGGFDYEHLDESVSVK